MYEDQPPFGADDKCRACLLRAAPARATACWAPPRASRALSVEQMRRLFPAAATARETSCWPPPGGSTSTDWSPRQSGAAAHWHAGRRPRRVEPAAAAAGFLAVAQADGHASNTSCNWPHGPAAADDDRYAAKLLATVLGDDSGSRLYWELVDPGLAEHVRTEPPRIRGRRASSSPT